MWKFQNFSVTQILREIKFGGDRASKSAILTNLGARNFNFYHVLEFRCSSTAVVGCVKLTDLGSEGVLSHCYQNVF